jgi:DNA/RNA endonuclease G (NUC1)
MLTVGFSAYYVTPERVANLLPGRDAFYEDPDLQAMGVAQAPVDSHAFNESWNRGHCAPSHIMSWSTESKQSCYTMANIAPQGGKFNQQTWAALEDHVAEWIGSSGNSLHIITGVAYKDRSNPARTFDNVGVPDYYFKVLCDVAHGQSVGFYGHNLDIISEECHTPHPVSEVEALYGGALFPAVCNPNSLNASHWFTFNNNN